jgi:transcription antitermination factor NusG
LERNGAERAGAVIGESSYEYDLSNPRISGSVWDAGERSPIDAFEGQWWVAHTRSRNEKALAADLDRIGIGYFLPLVRTRRCYGGRKTYVQIPLFAGYLFVCGGENERYATLMTHRVANVIRVADQDRLTQDLRHIFRAVSSGVPVDLYPGIRRGRRCRVARGCLRGLEGVVLCRRGRFRVHVAVDVLGQSAEVEIDPALLEVIE